MTSFTATTLTQSRGFLDGLFDGLFDGIFPPAPAPAPISSSSTTKLSATTSTLGGAGNNNGGGLFGGRTITFTKTEEITTTVTVATTEPFRIFPSKISYTLPAALTNVPTPTPASGIAIFPGLELPAFDLSKIHGPDDFLQFIESAISTIEKISPPNPLFGVIKFLIGEARKMEATKEMQLRLLLNVIAHFVQSTGQGSPSPLSPIFPLPVPLPGQPQGGIFNLGGLQPNPLQNVLDTILKGGKP